MSVTAGCGQPRGDGGWPPPGEISILETVPPQGAEGVAVDASIDLCLDGVLYPGALERFEVLLTSGGSAFDTEVEIALTPYRAPGRRDLLDASRWCPGSVVMVRPTEPLIPGATYGLRLVNGPHGWDTESLGITGTGWSLDEDAQWVFTLAFTTQAGTATPSLPLPTLDVMPLDALFEPGQVLSPTGGACSCHQRQGELARDVLDLSAPALAYVNLVGDATIQETGFPLVSTGYPAASYLLQRLIEDEDGGPLRGVLAAHRPSQAELDPADLAALSAWIATGALQTAGTSAPP